MLRSALSHYTQASRAIASSSLYPIAHLHTSAPLYIASERRRQIRGLKERQAAKRKEIAEGKAHVVLGTRPGDEVKWTSSDLGKVIITAEQIAAAPRPSLLMSENPRAPDFVNFGVGEAEKKLLFEVLPDLTLEASILTKGHSNQRVENNEPEMQRERYKTRLFTSLLDLRNANAGGIAFENRKRIVAEFSRPGQPNDTGLPEVQAAILTMRIRNVWDHLTKNRKDVMTRRNLRKLVHQRAKIMKYLKRLDRDRYVTVLGRLGLEAESVEGELVV
ncbi:hypothetical protein EUX98_g3950 [Antrodiella citrinella]|uniref:30S ribosomal protein S15 n=1 Tax=Antrodiella citrinella TaxID=2447956 RepID=A0A4S4MY14_9APHY|nr:hypothetical protein EUX98_g3950 [Antrodiella citrinella]